MWAGTLHTKNTGNKTLEIGIVESWTHDTLKDLRGWYNSHAAGRNSYNKVWSWNYPGDNTQIIPKDYASKTSRYWSIPATEKAKMIFTY